MSEASAKLQLRLQQLLLKVKQSQSNQCPSPISSNALYSFAFKDGVLEFFVTQDSNIFYYEFSGPDFDLDGYSVLDSMHFESQETIDKIPALMTAEIEKIWEQCNEDIRKESTLH